MVTHAVDFLHLADHVIILKKGEVKAKGTFDELVDDPHMMEIMSAHTDQLDLYKRTKSLSREYSMRSNNEQEKEFNFMSSDSEEVDIDGKKIA